MEFKIGDLVIVKEGTVRFTERINKVGIILGFLHDERAQVEFLGNSDIGGGHTCQGTARNGRGWNYDVDDLIKIGEQYENTNN